MSHTTPLSNTGIGEAVTVGVIASVTMVAVAGDVLWFTARSRR